MKIKTAELDKEAERLALKCWKHLVRKKLSFGKLDSSENWTERTQESWRWVARELIRERSK